MAEHGEVRLVVDPQRHGRHPTGARGVGRVALPLGGRSRRGCLLAVRSRVVAAATDQRTAPTTSQLEPRYRHPNVRRGPP